MQILDFNSVEKLIFEDPSTHRLFPSHFISYFESWKLSKLMPMLRQMGKSAVLDLLNNINDDIRVKLEEYFGERILVRKLHYDIVRNEKILLSDADDFCRKLEELDWFDYFTTWRDADYLYVSCWR